ncbi:hypothetical protein KJY73_07345 [Bowmanella sp. Y26]|uniref:glycoside hydrolase family 2 protein n=1 Tax=Bowmanella yangjiangensis TaxID=2811230 RepID=UPI001BDDA6AE|nr:glycoside hydrolase family 2 TIM barrel-domain containing protein [Bowmanella yangjiangensis]MBT1063384.1 hypothetical protein [Bowmanella yangjiangensis]
MSIKVRQNNHILLLLYFCLLSLANWRASADEASDTAYSIAGFHPLPSSSREHYNFNQGWRFSRTHTQSPEQYPQQWQLVNLPHTVNLVPSEASGGVNYQGPVSYTKKFSVKPDWKKRRIVLHFEAVMGTSLFYLNGELLKQHTGGYLPINLDISDKVRFDQPNLLTVVANNSDDPGYPPGKPQELLDFTYFGGIYRDVWMIVTDKLHITNANEQQQIAGGGVFVSFTKVSSQQAEVRVKTHVFNQNERATQTQLVTELYHPDGHLVSSQQTPINLQAKQQQHYTLSISVPNPALWTPQSPFLYQLKSYLLKGGKKQDGVVTKVGIRSIDFRGEDGLYLNGKPYSGKLIGVNRHQDFAYLGNALPNSGQWRDALLLKKAGVNIVRAAHYPMDPAFMDACDALGIFVIVPTPGWQFWNDAPRFAQLVLSDISQMVRRDRNRPSVLLWEPILNETNYPLDFAKAAHQQVHAEYPYPGAFTAADHHAKGSEFFDVLFKHPLSSDSFQSDFWVSTVIPTHETIQQYLDKPNTPSISYFTREWGDNVDDWSSHASTSRVARGWGESAQLQQAEHYAGTTRLFTSLNTLNQASRQFVGGTLWHGFDHQRGYHPEPFYGGITDAFRQPKYAHALFTSQRPFAANETFPAGTGPFVYIAHQMTPFSPEDVTVYSNCPQVRLTHYTQPAVTLQREGDNGFNAPFVFKQVFDFMNIKRLHRKGKADEAFMLAECLDNTEVVASHRLYPAARPVALRLYLQDEGIPLTADGADTVTLIAELVDERGTVRRLSQGEVQFSISGPASIVGDNLSIGANPRQLEWGSAPVLIKADSLAGEIVVTASFRPGGIHRPQAASLRFFSQQSGQRFLQSETAEHYYSVAEAGMSYTTSPNTPAKKLDEVIKAQNAFEKGQ